MDKTYIVADARFCDALAAQENNMSIDNYNNTIINNINSVVDADDTLLFIGNIGRYKNRDQIKELINSLTVKTKKCIDMRFQPSFNTREKLSDIGIERGYSIDGFVKDKIYDTKYFVVITSDFEYYKKLFNKPDEEDYHYYYAMPASVYPFSKLLDNKCFNISIKEWGLSPIEYNSLPRLIDNAKLFEVMEESEHESDI